MLQEVRPKAKRLWPRLVLAGGAVLFALAVLEVVFRVADIKEESNAPVVHKAFQRTGGPLANAVGGLIPYATIRTTYSSNPRGYFSSECYVDHQINSAGFRDTEHSILAPPDTYRILGLGDSFLFGQGVRSEDICLTRLEAELNQDARQFKVETINTGIPGRNTEEELTVLQLRGLRYKPDLAILFFVLNDADLSREIDGYQDNQAGASTERLFAPDFLSEHSYLWSWARQRWARHFGARRFVADTLAEFQPTGENWRRCEVALDGIRATCQEQGIPLLMVVFPFFHDLNGDYPFQSIHDQLRVFAESRRLPLLDLRDSYRGYVGPELWVHATDQHPNEMAHEIAANAVADFVREHAHELRFDQPPVAQREADPAMERRLQAEARLVQLGGGLSEDRTTVLFHGREISDVDLNLLTEYWPEFDALTAVSLRGTRIADASLSRISAAVQQLQALDLSGTRVELKDPESLLNLTGLERLALEDLPIGDEQLRHLAGLSQLKLLTLGGTKITDAGLVHLRALQQLETLGLARSAIGDAGIKHLEMLPNLKAIDLTGTRVTDDGVQRLLKSRPALQIVR